MLRRDEYLAAEALWAMGAEERLAYLRRAWDTPEGRVRGTLVSIELDGKTEWVLGNLQNAEGRPIEYPVADLAEALRVVGDRVPIGTLSGGCAEGDEVEGMFALADEDDLSESGSPVLIQIEASSVAPLLPKGVEERSPSTGLPHLAAVGRAGQENLGDTEGALGEGDLEGLSQSPQVPPGPGVSPTVISRQLRMREVTRMSDVERMAFLREAWRLTEDVLYGRLLQERRGPANVIWWLTEIRNAEGSPLTFPVLDMPNPHEKQMERVFVGQALRGFREDDWVRGRFGLSPESIREQRSNPLAIGVIPGSVERVRRVMPVDVRVNSDGTVHVSEALAMQVLEADHADAVAAVERLRAQRDDLSVRVETSEGKRREAEEAAAAAAKALVKATAEEQNARRRRKRVLKGVSEQARKARGEKTAELRATAAEVEAKMEEWVVANRAAMDSEKSEHQDRIRAMQQQTERLQAYVREHADRLVRLDLITEDQRRELLGDDRDIQAEMGSRPTPSTMDEGWAGVVPRVQRYLFERGVVYPRALLETYLAVLKAGDLVVLSGLSGSGKTQLVKAFADATGGVAHVVPVKPNWTSSEDLLGYYNPLQRAYLTTPFLDALIAAKRDPGRMHYVCLDEMNLARVEYYFADFLSAMETRGAEGPSVPLYSDEEAGHVAAEFRVFVDVVLEAAGSSEHADLGELLRDGDIAARLHERLGVGDRESLVELHGRLRRMVSGVLNVPSTLAVPPNVRVVGAVNVDETTYTLAPKVLDRAHVLRFESPLDVWDLVAGEVAATDEPGEQVFLPAEGMVRGEYPRYNPSVEDGVVSELTRWRRDFFVPLGLDFGLRTARQAMQYRDELGHVTGAVGEALDAAALVHVLRQKVLPRFTFDGRRLARAGASTVVRDKMTGLEVVDAFLEDVRSLGPVGPYNVRDELDGLSRQAQSERAGGIFNYWS